MEKTNVQKLAKILKLLVTITFVCNLIILPLVPGIVGIGFEAEGWGAFEGIIPYESSPWQMPVRVGITFCWPVGNIFFVFGGVSMLRCSLSSLRLAVFVLRPFSGRPGGY